jgi:hypothetical protein
MRIVFGICLAAALGIFVLLAQTPTTATAEAARRSGGCLTCHTGIEDMHNGKVPIACTDCHGGNAGEVPPAGAAKGSPDWQAAMHRAHVAPRFPDQWKTSANPQRTYTLLNRESPEFIRFINPGDLRVASQSCASSGCHSGDIHNVGRSMMATGSMLWGAALYNNGAFRLKNYQFGESYSVNGFPQRLETSPPPSAEETRTKGELPFLLPLPRWEITPPGNILRAFEAGGKRPAEVGMPAIDETSGRPTQNLLSARGTGTGLRTDPVFLGLQKTRLLDPTLSFLGTNDQPGDYRSSGCTACHVIYANDRDAFHSGPYASAGHNGFSHSSDPMIPKDEPGHPIRHQFTRAIPSSQCVVCHMHPGTLVLSSFYGVTWWDLETDGKEMYPATTKHLTAAESQAIRERNPEGSAQRGLWGLPDFLEKLSDLNTRLKHTQFADFNGHGWIYRAVFKQDRKGNMLDPDGKIVPEPTSAQLQKSVQGEAQPGLPVHLKDIHMEKGMHCVDCHFKQDNHGNGKLYGEVRDAIEIDCVDCHGTIRKRADPTALNARTTAAAGGNRMLDYRTVMPVNASLQSSPLGQDRFYMKDGHLYQRSAVDQGKQWEVAQVLDSITPGNARYNEKARLAKTMHRDGKTWGNVPASDSELAHANSTMTCYACHTSWTPSCFGCHLRQQANQNTPMLHNEGEATKNWTSYNFQTLRDDVFMLGRDGTVTGGRIAPLRSACAVLVSSQNANREWIYAQQQTISAEGYSGTAFSSHFPHSVRTKETKGCADCHLSSANDNNAYVAMLLAQGTNFYNFVGHYAWVGEGKAGFDAVAVTEHDEPQAVIGSTLHRLAYPESFRAHEQVKGRLQEAYHHAANGAGIGNAEVLDVQLRGEYLYAATGTGGLRIFDVANIDHKGFSQRIISAPVSPLGQRLSVPTKYAMSVASPSTLAIDPTRSHRPENEEAQNRSDHQPIHPIYAFLYVADREEGLVVVGDPKKGVSTLLDGNPSNNFLRRALAWNPGGILKGANHITIAGTFAYITAERGLAIVDLDNPLQPRLAAFVESPALRLPRDVQIQFRYAFVTDADGVKVIEITDPRKPRPVPNATVPLADAKRLYLVRTYAYVAAGKQGLAILDIERPEKPKLLQIYNAAGAINDARDVKVGMTNVSLFAYIADGVNGLRVVQLTSPEYTQGNTGFSPAPDPRLIATYPTGGPALAISEGLDRDRAVDEAGNQLSVFGRRGARPLNGEEMKRMYLRPDGTTWSVPEINEVADIRRLFGQPAGGR